MLYREIVAVFSQIHTKHINTLCGQNVELLDVKMVVHIMTTGLFINFFFFCENIFVISGLVRLQRNRHGRQI